MVQGTESGARDATEKKTDFLHSVRSPVSQRWSYESNNHVDHFAKCCEREIQANMYAYDRELT